MDIHLSPCLRQALTFALTIMACVGLSACSRGSRPDRAFGFGVYNRTNYEMDDVVVRFIPRGGTFAMGGIGTQGAGSMEPYPGPVPDAAEIRWTEAPGTAHSVRVQITPLAPPTRTSYIGPGCRKIYFVVNGDSSVTVFSHHPGLPD